MFCGAETIDDFFLQAFIMASKNSITFEPIKERKLIGDKYFFLLMPFGDATSVNVLELFLGTPDIETNVSIFWN